MEKLRKGLSVLLCFVMVVGLLPVSVFAASAANVWVGGVAMQDGEYLLMGATETTDEAPDDNYAYYDDGRLTLVNYSYSGAGYMNSAIRSEQDLVVELVGDNYLTPSASGDGIYCTKNLKVTGQGFLSITDGLYGIVAEKNLSIGGYIYIQSKYECLYADSGDIIIDCYELDVRCTDTQHDESVWAIRAFETGNVRIASGEARAAVDPDGKLGAYVSANHNTYDRVWVGTPRVWVAGIPMLEGDYLEVGATATTLKQPQDKYAYYTGGVLTLYNYSYTGEGCQFEPFEERAAIYGNKSFIVLLQGTNYIKGTTGTTKDVYGIFSEEKLSIGGSGSLTVNATADAFYSVGDMMCVGTDLDVEYAAYDGMDSEGVLTLANCTVTIRDAAMEGIEGEEITIVQSDVSVDSYKDCLAAYAGVNVADNSALDAVSENGAAIYSEYGDIMIYSSAANLESRNGIYKSEYNYLEETGVLIYGSDVTIYGGGIYGPQVVLYESSVIVESNAFGISAWSLDLTVTNSNVDIKSMQKTYDDSHCAIAVNGELIIDADLTVRASTDTEGKLEAFDPEKIWEYDWVRFYKEDPGQVNWISASTTLGGDIGLNFYVMLADALAEDSSVYVRFTFAGKTLDIPVSGMTKDNKGRYKFTCPINAKNMSDAVTAQVMKGDDFIGDPLTMRVTTYCNYMITNSNDTKLVELMKAMLNYGAAAQLLFNYRTDDLANAGLRDEDKILADVDASAYASKITGSEAGIAVSSATLMLETETSVRIYFKLTGSKTIDQYTFYADGVKVAPVAKDGKYYVEITDIAAQDLDKTYTIVVGGLTIKYSGLSYVNTVIKNPSVAGEALVNAAKAIFAYNKTAENYFNS